MQTTKGELDHGTHETVTWIAVRWLDTDYTECSAVVAAHGTWDDDDPVEVITQPTGDLCDAHAENLNIGPWTETHIRRHCLLTADH